MMMMMTMVQLLLVLAAVLAAGHRPSTYQPTGMPKGPLSMLNEQDLWWLQLGMFALQISLPTARCCAVVVRNAGMNCPCWTLSLLQLHLYFSGRALQPNASSSF